MRLALRSLRADATSATVGARPRVCSCPTADTGARSRRWRRIARDDARMEVEARRAIASGVAFHSFGLGPAAESADAHALAQIAGATGGTYRAFPIRAISTARCSLRSERTRPTDRAGFAGRRSS
jgi:hypothetical protein